MGPNTASVPLPKGYMLVAKLLNGKKLLT